MQIKIQRPKYYVIFKRRGKRITQSIDLTFRNNVRIILPIQIEAIQQFQTFNADIAK